MKFKCPCCGYRTLSEAVRGSYEVCQVCFWEDDGLQFEYPDYEGGANSVSLIEARRNYLIFGACDLKAIPFVREPYEDELDHGYIDWNN